MVEHELKILWGEMLVLVYLKKWLFVRLDLLLAVVVTLETQGLFAVHCLTIYFRFEHPIGTVLDNKERVN